MIGGLWNDKRAGTTTNLSVLVLRRTVACAFAEETVVADVANRDDARTRDVGGAVFFGPLSTVSASVARTVGGDSKSPPCSCDLRVASGVWCADDSAAGAGVCECAASLFFRADQPLPPAIIRLDVAVALGPAHAAADAAAAARFAI